MKLIVLYHRKGKVSIVGGNGKKWEGTIFREILCGGLIRKRTGPNKCLGAIWRWPCGNRPELQDCFNTLNCQLILTLNVVGYANYQNFRYEQMFGKHTFVFTGPIVIRQFRVLGVD